jgi:hypothetical protein
LAEPWWATLTTSTGPTATQGDGERSLRFGLEVAEREDVDALHVGRQDDARVVGGVVLVARRGGDTARGVRPVARGRAR